VAGDAEEGGLARVLTAGGEASLTAAGGTSDSAPLWGGIMALADQYARHDLGFVNPIIYEIGRSSGYHRAFHDVRTGTNGYPAAPGWDPVTGWGSPNARALVPLLDRLASHG
jgi:subtilase family serine protease